MFPFSALLSLLLFVISGANATPIRRNSNTHTLSLASKINAIGGQALADIDRARASALLNNVSGKKNGERSGKPVILTDKGVTYTASVGVGSPATHYTLIVDTGSSNTWVGAGKAYARTSSSDDTGDSVSVGYGSGSFSGEEYIDTVTLSYDLVIKQQSIGVASQSQGFVNVDGILGVGPVDLTSGTVSNTETVPTVVDNLFAHGSISSDSLGVFFQPSTALELLDAGELSFGGPDETKTTGSIAYVPITGTSPASGYWGIDQSVTYGGTTILSSTAGIVDTGTTLILLATDAFNAYQAATGGTPDQATGLLKISNAQYDALKPLNFNIGGHTYPLSRNAQIWPRALNSAVGGDLGSIYLIVGDIGNPSGSGLDFINGYAFLQRFYSVYDTGNRQVGFATTAFTDAKTN